MSAEIINRLSQVIDNPYLLILLLSMLPVTELKGSILYSAVVGINPILAWTLCTVASCTIIPILLFTLNPVLNALKKFKAFSWINNVLSLKFGGKAKKMHENALINNSDILELYQERLMLALFLFVAIPLPLTGVWAGTAIACFTDLERRKSLLPLISGNFCAGGIITIISMLLLPYSALIFNVFFILALAITVTYLIFELLKLLPKRKTNINSGR